MANPSPPLLTSLEDLLPSEAHHLMSPSYKSARLGINFLVTITAFNVFINVCGSQAAKYHEAQQQQQPAAPPANRRGSVNVGPNERKIQLLAALRTPPHPNPYLIPFHLRWTTTTTTTVKDNTITH
ncbi:hypothetical protein V9T40_005032 [Parthenolecanium corni]|uniref:Uncharacterized protein n=1 Tax=Parthenolecanium corni TaxID=536013 RepID=A0AAN9TH46_9HEMI